LKITNYKNISKKIVQILKTEDKFVLFIHKYPDGDAMGSLLALFCLLKKWRKNVEIAWDDEIPYQYIRLPYANNLKKNHPQINSKTILISLDNSTNNMINSLYPNLNSDNYKMIINIDHHYKNTKFGDINLIIPEAASVTQILYDIFKENKIKIDIEMAECIYTGLVTDSGRFQYINTTVHSHLIAADLISMGVNPNKIFKSTYENKPKATLNLHELMIKRTKTSKGGSLIYSHVLQDDLKKLNLQYSASTEFVDVIRAIENVKLAAVFKQQKDGTYRVSLRSSSDIDVSKIANKFGGGGHPMAAGYLCRVKKLNECIKHLEDEFIIDNYKFI